MPRSLFWRTLQVAASDFRAFLVLVLAGSALGGAMIVTARAFVFGVNVSTVLAWLAVGTFFVALLRPWWLGCRRRAARRADG